MICTYCQLDVIEVKQFRMGAICNNCELEISDLMNDLGDTSFYSNHYFACWWNKDFFKLGIGFDFNGWFELDLGFMSIKSNHN